MKYAKQLTLIETENALVGKAILIEEAAKRGLAASGRLFRKAENGSLTF